MVAIHKLPEFTDDLAKALAGALGNTVYEAALRLRASKEGPLVVGVFEGQEQAEELREKLQAGSFHVILLAQDDVETPRVVRKPAFSEEGFRLEPRQGKGAVIPYANIKVLLRATGFTSSTEIETVKEKKLSLGKAVLTSGLSVSKTTETTHEKTVETRENFFHLYDTSSHVYVFHESELIFEALGSDIKPTRMANYNFIIEELRRLCPGLRYDDRLKTLLAQTQLLGPKLSPDRHLPLALSLLAKSLLN